MSFEIPALTGPVPEQHAALLESARALAGDETSYIATAANLSALVYHALPQLNWVGFYFAHGDELVVGPFQGKPACIRIPFGRGVCGTAAATRTIQRVADVHAVPDHIACDPDSRSELVIPMSVGKQTVGVFDLDSPVPDRFTEADEELMSEIGLLVLERMPGRYLTPEIRRRRR
ncbi:GAF domain-containing protein [Gordonia sp. CPCC 205515]|uniref:GAF domain-containing protein n=1 Tax=Gordonia sp. CPCC 205515 TaxID=3140791 RepID=UPI003AF37A53